MANDVAAKCVVSLIGWSSWLSYTHIVLSCFVVFTCNVPTFIVFSEEDVLVEMSDGGRRERTFTNRCQCSSSTLRIALSMSSDGL